MDFLGGFPTTNGGNVYDVVVLDLFNKMEAMIPHKTNATMQQATQLFIDKI